MALLWYWTQDQWHADPLSAAHWRLYQLSNGIPKLAASNQVTFAVGPLSVGRRYCFGLVGRAQLRINGSPFWGVHVLADGDQIRLGTDLLFFADRPVVQLSEDLPEGLGASCPVCGDRLTAPAVRCPDCQVWHHESKALPCWSSGPQCSTYGCQQPTALDQAIQWTPAQLNLGGKYGCAPAAG